MLSENIEKASVSCEQNKIVLYGHSQQCILASYHKEQWLKNNEINFHCGIYFYALVMIYHLSRYLQSLCQLQGRRPKHDQTFVLVSKILVVNM